MRRILGLSLTLILVVPVVAVAKTPTRHHTQQYVRAYAAVVHKFGHRAPGRNIVRWGLAHRRASDADVVTSLGVLYRMLHPAPAPVVVYHAAVSTSAYHSPVSSTPVASAGGGYANVPGVPASFAACVARTESTNGAGSSNIYGIQGPGGTGSVAEQKAAFARMYAARGSQPWSPYDGC